MLYTAYELNRKAGAPVVAASQLTAQALQALSANANAFNALKSMSAFQALAANPSFAAAMGDARFAASLSNQ